MWLYFQVWNPLILSKCFFLCAKVSFVLIRCTSSDRGLGNLILPNSR